MLLNPVILHNCLSNISQLFKRKFFELYSRWKALISSKKLCIFSYLDFSLNKLFIQIKISLFIPTSQKREIYGDTCFQPTFFQQNYIPIEIHVRDILSNKEVLLILNFSHVALVLILVI